MEYETPQEAAKDKIRTSPFANWANVIPRGENESTQDYVHRIDAGRRGLSEMIHNSKVPEAQGNWPEVTNPVSPSGYGR